MLTPRQMRLYTYRVNLFRPQPAAARQDLEPYGAQDVTYALPADYKAVACYYQATENYSELSDLGRTKQENIFTSDQFHFDAAQDIADAWVIQMLAPGTPLHLVCWEVKGSPKVALSQGHRCANYAQVYGRIIPTPDALPTVPGQAQL